MSGQIKLKAASLGGDITLTPTDTASNLVVTIPATAGNMVVSSTDLAFSPYVGFRNRIINGGMTIDQRNSGASVTPASGAVTYVLDRWNFFVTQASKLTVQQSSTAPAGFTKSTLVTSSSAYSVVAADRFQTTQPIEGFNVADLGWGTANAQTVTLSFVVRSSLTGTFGGAIKNGDGTRSYPFTYTISAANTFETKSVTVAGDTTGTWATNNTSGILVTFGIGVGTTFSGTAGAWASANYDSATGAVSVVATSGATFYITGVQLEKGSTATPFEFRAYGQELALCQRYYQKLTLSIGQQYAAFGGNIPAATRVSFPVTMRAAPTVTFTNISATLTNSVFANYISVDGFSYQVNVTATGVYVREDVASMGGAEL
jgi:hypothetical protein